jgi:hypothetical protein
MRLPRHLAVFAAFWDSLDETETKGMDYVGRSSSGIMRYFEDGGLDLVCRDGLDERLESRYRLDPPEFVTVMHGDGGGLHYGLWYDDPAHLPHEVVKNWARDDPTTLDTETTTPLGVLREEMDDFREELGFDNEEDDDLDENDLDENERAGLAAGRAVEAFALADEQAWEADGGWSGIAAQGVEKQWVETLGCPGLVLPRVAGDPVAGTTSEERRQAYTARSADWMIDWAERELAAGRPAFAAVVGHELRFEDFDEYRDRGWNLLIAAYRALGRHALADIAAVHYASLDLVSTHVLTSPTGTAKSLIAW